MTPDERKEITADFRYEFEQFSKNKIDPIISTVQADRTTLVDHGERLAAHRQRIKDVEKFVEGVDRDVKDVADDLDTAKESHRSDFIRVLVIVISALATILAAVIGLGYLVG